VFIIPTYTEGRPPEGAAWFCKWLEEASNDFRVERQLLKGMKFAVFGLGNSQYRDHFNEVSHFPYWRSPQNLAPRSTVIRFFAVSKKMSG
jgi:sulfite reductase alpha subunit-like flavoprotein